MTEHRTDSGISYSRAGEGPAIVLIHGWCCDRSFLAPQHDHLAHRHTVLSLDLRGHGASAPPAEPAYAVSDFAEDVADVITDAGVASPVVVGHSLGGLVALEVAVRGAASAAVLLDPAPMLDARGRGYFQRSWHEVAADVDGSWRRRFIERIMLPGDVVRREEILRVVASVDPLVASEAMRGMADYDAARALSTLTVPTLIVSAAPSEDVTAARAIRPQLMTGQTVGAGHFIQIEVPEQVNAMIDRFLSQLPHVIAGAD